MSERCSPDCHTVSGACSAAVYGECGNPDEPGPDCPYLRIQDLEREKKEALSVVECHYHLCGETMAELFCGLFSRIADVTTQSNELEAQLKTERSGNKSCSDEIVKLRSELEAERAKKKECHHCNTDGCIVCDWTGEL